MRSLVSLLTLPLVGCSLIAGGKASLSGGKPAAPSVAGASSAAPAASQPSDELQRHLNYINSHLDGAEQQVSSEDPSASSTHLELARAELDKLSAADRARPEVQLAERRWKKLSGRTTGVAQKQEKAARGEAALGQAQNARRSGDGHYSRSDRNGLTGIEMAIKSYGECVSILDGAFKADPGLKKKQHGEETGAKTMATCKQNLDEAKQAYAALYAKERQENAEIVVKVFKFKWKDANGFADRAEKRLKNKKDEFAVINAHGDLESAVKDFDDLLEVCKSRVEPKKLQDLALDKQLTAGQMCEQAKQRMAAAQAQYEKIKAAYDKAYERFEQKIYGSLKGDRARLVKSKGLPSWFDGANLVDSRDWLQAILHSPYYRYDNSDGCQVTHYFSGNNLKKTMHDPPNCS